MPHTHANNHYIKYLNTERAQTLVAVQSEAYALSNSIYKQKNLYRYDDPPANRDRTGYTVIP